MLMVEDEEIFYVSFQFYSLSLGNSDGLLSIWCNSKGSLLFSFISLRDFDVCLEWGMDNTTYFVINIYFKSSLREKRSLWKDLLLRRINLGREVWCVLGEFKHVCYSSEIMGENGFAYNVSNIECIEFSNFIYEMSLLDLPPSW